MSKPFAESCEINRHPILEVLNEIFADRRRVLEIASARDNMRYILGTRCRISPGRPANLLKTITALKNG